MIVYVIMGSWGDYDGSWDWNVIAFHNKNHADDTAAWLNRIHDKLRKRCEIAKRVYQATYNEMYPKPAYKVYTDSFEEITEFFNSEIFPANFLHYEGTEFQVKELEIV